MKMTTFFYEQTLKTVTEIMKELQKEPKSDVDDYKWNKLWNIQENLIDLLNIESRNEDE